MPSICSNWVSKHMYRRVNEFENESTEKLFEGVSCTQATKETGAGSHLSYVWVLNFVLLLVNVSLLSIQYFSYPEQQFQSLEMSPAASVIKFESKLFDIGNNGELHSPYVGRPREENERAWNELMRYQNIHIEPRIMQDLGRADQGVLLPDGSGYLATINAFHLLHCVRNLYMTLYLDHFLPNMTVSERRDHRIHMEHCLENLREATMCNADVSLVTLRWGTHQAVPLANWTYPHVCKNWAAVIDWAKERNVPRVGEKDWLMHPKFGWAYADTGRLGVAHDD